MITRRPRAKISRRKFGMSAVAHNKAFENLKCLGFTEYEARIYVQVLRRGQTTAYEISKSANVPRPNAYHALEVLAKRGAVLPISENPVRYVAADPDELLDAIARQTKALCSDLAEQLSAVASSSDNQYVWALRGETAIHDKMNALIAGSRKAVWIKAADDILRRYKDALGKAARRGVDILIVMFGVDPDEFRFNDASRVYVHEANGLRMGTADNLFTVAIDHREMLTAAMEEDLVAAHTRNRAIVAIAESLIRHDYYMAEIAARFGRQIDKAFGPHLRDLRIACFSPEQIASFKQRTGLTETSGAVPRLAATRSRKYVSRNRGL